MGDADLRTSLLRDATSGDVPQLVTLVESAYRGEASRAGWTTEADLLEGQRTDPDTLREVLDSPDCRFLLLERDAELVACCQLHQQDDVAHFGMFSVRPTVQGQGVGSFVLAEAERFARATWGAHWMEMKVLAPRADLISWYERRGYHRTGGRSAFPYGDERFGLPRRDDLVFEHFGKSLMVAEEP